MKIMNRKQLASCVGVAVAMVVSSTAMAVKNGGGDEIILQGWHWNSAKVVGQHANGNPQYLAQGSASQGSLEKFSPYCPGDAGYSAVVFDWTANNGAGAEVQASKVWVDDRCTISGSAAAKSYNWYQLLNDKAQEINDIGITSVWMPPPWSDSSSIIDSKTGKQMNAEGYTWNGFGIDGSRNGAVITGQEKHSAYGSDEDLKTAAGALDGLGVSVVYDIVANHTNVMDYGMEEPKLYKGAWDCDTAVPGRDLNNNGLGDCVDVETDPAYQFFDPTEQGAWAEHGNGAYQFNEDGDSFSGDLNFGNQLVVDLMRNELKNLKDNYYASGFRFDYVRGFKGQHVNAWLNDTEINADFAVGEMWKAPSDYMYGGNCSYGVDPDQNRMGWSTTDITNWCNSNDWQNPLKKWSDEADATVFDFALADRMRNGEIADWKNGLNSNSTQSWREAAVTFIDNHDLGWSPGYNGGQGHWPFPSEKWGSSFSYRDAAYAFILATPGTPTIYWPDLFDDFYGNRATLIKQLIAVRRTAGVVAGSSITYHNGNSGIAATVFGNDENLVLSLGSDLTDPTTVATGPFILAASGAWGKIWMTDPNAIDQVFTTVAVRGTNNAFGTTDMTLTLDNTWELTGIEVSCSESNPRFAIEPGPTYDWADKYVDNGPDGVLDADPNGADIALSAGPGMYKVVLNDATLNYSVTKTADTDCVTEITDPEDNGTDNSTTDGNVADNTDNGTAGGYQRTIILVHGTTSSGQDLFMRGGVDHGYAASDLGKTCTATNYECAIPIRQINTLNPYTFNWKQGENYLDWYGAEALQGSRDNGGYPAEGSPLEWTTGDAGNPNTYDSNGFGYALVNDNTDDADHYWLFDVEMDCSYAAPMTGDDGNTYRIVEAKTYISNGPGWESDKDTNLLDIFDANGADTGDDIPVYLDTSGNHYFACGMVNVMRRDSNQTKVYPMSVAIPAP